MLNATVIIPSVYVESLVRFLESNAAFLSDVSVIIVSSDSRVSEKLVRTYLKHTKVVLIDKPLGFAKTVNIGMRQARTKWIATCNDDVLLSDGWLKKLIAAADTKTGGCNPVIKSGSGSIESAGISVLPTGKAVAKTTSPKQAVFATEALNAACVVYRREALIAAGYFDERFDSYLEDIDLSLTLTELGWKQLVARDVEVTHLGQQTSSKLLGAKKPYLDMRNWWLILFKHWSPSTWLSHLPGIVLERVRNISGVLKAVPLLTLVIALLPLLFAFCFNLVNSYSFDNDFGRDLVDIAAITRGDITLLGPKLSFGGLHTGPYYYYLFAPILFLFPGQPEMILYANAGIAWAMLVLTGIVLIRREKWSLATTLLSLYWIGLSGYYFYAARGPGNAFSYIGLLILLLALYPSIGKVRRWWIWALYGLAWGVAINFHLVVLFIALPLLLALGIHGRVVRALSLFAGATLSFAPLALFEVTHNFVMLRNTFIDKSYVAFTNNTNLINPLKTSDNSFVNAWLFTTQAGSWVTPSLIVLIVAIIVLLVVFWKKTSVPSKALALSLVVSVGLVAVSAHSQLAFHYFFPFIALAQVVVLFLIARLRFVKLVLTLAVVLSIVALGSFWHQPSNRQLGTFRAVAQTIRTLPLAGELTQHPFAVFITRETPLAPLGFEYRYFLSTEGLTSVDPFSFANATLLLWIAEEPITEPERVTSWELEQFGDRRLIATETIGTRTIYLYAKQ